MKSIFKTSPLPSLIWVTCLLLPFLASTQTIDQPQLNSLIEDGKIDQAMENLHHFLGPQVEISQDDSAYALKTLGMLYTQNGNIDSAKIAFKSLFLLDPTASIRNTDASYSIIEVFNNAKNEFKKEHGGEILRPRVVVMNARGAAIEDKYRASIARQFIEELQRLWLFEALNWDDIQNQFQTNKTDPSKCKDEACYIKMAQEIEADKIILLNFEKINNVFSLVLKYIDVSSKKTESLLKRATVNNLDTLILSGLQDMAIELEKENAAWLQFSLEPGNAYLELNNSPTDDEKRIPVMPGKHKVCASATGFETLCKTLEVNPRDGLTHRLALKPILSENAENLKTNTENQKTTTDPESKAKPFKTELYILGGLTILALGLLFLFN